MQDQRDARGEGWDSRIKARHRQTPPERWRSPCAIPSACPGEEEGGKATPAGQVGIEGERRVCPWGSGPARQQVKSRISRDEPSSEGVFRRTARYGSAAESRYGVLRGDRGVIRHDDQERFRRECQVSFVAGEVDMGSAGQRRGQPTSAALDRHPPTRRTIRGR